jgi:Saxitoxin biosynthesis operon protein SxtJ
MMLKSNRSFGLIIGFASALIAAIHFWSRREDYLVWLIPALIFIAVSLLMPRTLAPLKRLWLKLGELLSAIVSPIVLALLYVASIVATGILIRLLGKDLLSLKRKSGDATYWIERNPPGPDRDSLVDQF